MRPLGGLRTGMTLRRDEKTVRGSGPRKAGRHTPALMALGSGMTEFS
jgi:hypothetical protein